MRRVDPKQYTQEYYLTDCTGHEEFKKSFGEILELRFKELIKYFRITPGTKVLDIGCGRGEMALYCAKKGAIAVGIDYSEEAINLAKWARSKHSKKIKEKTNFYVLDAKRLNFKSSSFDLVILTDVVEHLYPEELDLIFKEVKRVLKRNGKLIIHTAPNKWFNDIAYKYYSYPISTAFISFWNFFLRRAYPNIAKPNNLRVDSHVVMHINEHTYFSLKKLYKKHKFEGSVASTNITAKKPEISLKDVIYNFFVFLHPISKKFPVNIIFGSDFVSILKNKK